MCLCGIRVHCRDPCDNYNLLILIDYKIPAQDVSLLRGRAVALLLRLGEPDGVPAAIRVFNDMRYHPKTIGFQQRSILIGSQARVIERFATIRANDFTVRYAAGKHQRGAW